MHFRGFCEEACPVDAVVETRVPEYHGGAAASCNTEADVAGRICDRYEAEIAADRNSTEIPPTGVARWILKPSFSFLFRHPGVCQLARGDLT